jgi:hypothetical protein
MKKIYMMPAVTMLSSQMACRRGFAAFSLLSAKEVTAFFPDGVDGTIDE